MTLSPHDVIQNGTKVQVKDQLGLVVSHEIVNAIPTGKIVVHTINFTHKLIRTRTSSGKTILKYVEIKPTTRTVNYSFIKVI